jgi:hypothetical protein
MKVSVCDNIGKREVSEVKSIEFTTLFEKTKYESKIVNLLFYDNEYQIEKQSWLTMIETESNEFTVMLHNGEAIHNISKINFWISTETLKVNVSLFVHGESIYVRKLEHLKSIF